MKYRKERLKENDYVLDCSAVLGVGYSPAHDGIGPILGKSLMR